MNNKILEDIKKMIEDRIKRTSNVIKAIIEQDEENALKYMYQRQEDENILYYITQIEDYGRYDENIY